MLYSLLSLSSTLGAATFPLVHYQQDHWTTRHGLPNNSINAITQTAEGYLWFATWEGVARYNGNEFRVFTRGEETGLLGSGLRSLTLDGAGVWVTDVRGGVSHYQDGTWSPQAKNNIENIVNHVLRDENDLLWFATAGEGIYVRQGEKILAHFDMTSGLPSNDVYTLVQDEAGRIWAGTAQGLIWIADNKVHVVAGIPEIPVPALLINRQGQLLIGTAAGLYQAEETAVLPINFALANTSITSLLQDNHDDLWLGTSDQGLLRVSALGVERLTVAQGLPDRRVLSLFQDNEESIWVGTLVGLMRLRDVPFVSFTEQEGMNDNHVRTVLAHSDGSVWAGSSTGMTRIKDGQLESLPLLMPDGRSASVTSLAEGIEGELWVGTFSHGLLQVKQRKVIQHYNVENGLASNEVRAILPDVDGGVWVGTSVGLNRLINKQLQIYDVGNFLPSTDIMDLHQTVTGDIWIGTRQGAAFIRDGKLTSVDLKSQDNATHVFGFYSEANADYVWLATDAGLIRYRATDASLALISKNRGLPVEKIFEALHDNNGYLWLTSNSGITRISLAEAHRVADGLQNTIKFEQFDERDGMASRQAGGANAPSATLDAQGRIWVATPRGVTCADPARLTEFPHTSFPIVVEALKVSGKPLAIKTPVVLQPGSERIQFHYAGLGFVMPERIQYRTWLEGFDKGWVMRGQQHSAEYTNLPPGDYVFRVAAAYSYRDWHEHEARITFTVLPFIWQRPFFWLIIAALVLVSLWLLMRLRLRMLIARATELECQVADKTQELQLQAEQLQRQAHAFEHQAKVDMLTGLPNRRAFDEALSQAFTRAKRSALPITLVVIDIDHFKHVNDTWSHGVGDQVLKIVADIICREIREVDIPARWGGEEFTLLLADTDVDDALPICERVRLAVMNYDYSHIDTQFKLTISLGVAQTQSGIDEHKLLANADQALYQAKHYGRNRVVIFNESKKTI